MKVSFVFRLPGVLLVGIVLTLSPMVLAGAREQLPESLSVIPRLFEQCGIKVGVRYLPDYPERTVQVRVNHRGGSMSDIAGCLEQAGRRGILPTAVRAVKDGASLCAYPSSPWIWLRICMR